jgi:hypothetical protein
MDIPPAPKLARAVVTALLVAAVLLVTVVLPAEYGIDLLGAGKALGLTGMAAPLEAEPIVAPAAGAKVMPTVQGPIALYPTQFKVDSREFTLGPYEYVEFKYHLEKDATMFFSWRASEDVIHDFHGDPDGAPSSAAQSFEKKPRRGADGSFTAPFAGIHGWYWENPGGETITIKLTTVGFYTSAHEFHYDGSRGTREVSGLDVIPVAHNQEK